MEKKSPLLEKTFAWLHKYYRMRRKGELIVKRIPKDGKARYHGYVETWPGHYRIYIDSRATVSSQIETLLHEFAHLKSRSTADAPHSKIFYAWQSRIETDYWLWREQSGIRNEQTDGR